MPVLVFAGMIFYLSSQSLDFITEDPFPHWDKVVHATEFGLFCFLNLRALRGTFPKAAMPAIAAWAILIAVSYGASDEFHQAFVPGRESDLLDLLADAGGAFLASTLWFYRSLRRPS